MRHSRIAVLAGLLAAVLCGCGSEEGKQPKVQNNPDIQFQERPPPVMGGGGGGGGGGPPGGGSSSAQ